MLTSADRLRAKSRVNPFSIVAIRVGAVGNGADVTLDFTGAGVQTGDIIVAMSGLGGSQAIPAAPTGFTSLATQTSNDLHDSSGRVSWKTQTGGLTTLVMPGTGNGDTVTGAAAIVVRGGGSIAEVVSASGIDGCRANPPALTPRWPPCYLYFGIGGHVYWTASTPNLFTSSDLNDFASAASGDTVDATVGCGWSDTVTDPAQFSCSSESRNSWVAFSVAMGV